jgi:LacI family transcriptional regulator
MDEKKPMFYVPAMKSRKTSPRATLRDIAAMVGVSLSSVSQALNGKGALSEELRVRIKETAAALDYSPNPAARVLRGGCSNAIGLVINHFNNPFFRNFLLGVEEVTDKARIAYFVSQTHDELHKEQLIVRKLAEQGADGLIVLNCSSQYRHLKAVSDSFSIPIVLISHTLGGHFAAVQADNFHGGRLAVDHLLGLDNRPLLHIAGPEEKSGLANRKAGFLQGLSRARPGIALENVCYAVRQLTAAVGYELMERILKEHELPIGLFVVNDEVALGVLTYCRRHKLEIPKDVAVVGFSDIDILETLDIPLTTIRIPQQRMGAAAAQTLLDLMGHPKNRECPPILTLPVSLVVRASTVGSRADEH